LTLSLRAFGIKDWSQQTYEEILMKDHEIVQIVLGDLSQDFERMFVDAQTPGSLAEEDKELILLGAYASKRDSENASKHGRRALALGVAPEAIVEVVLTATLSRGPHAIRAAQDLLNDLQIHSGSNTDTSLGMGTLDFFRAEYGEIPAWVEHLDLLSPQYLASYARLRKRIQMEGIVSGKVKELLTMLLNTFDGSKDGTKIHAMNAVGHGASWEEVEDTLLMGVQVGGIVVWIIGSGAIYDLIHDRRK
jgi:alkylhydroperoxidase/carboxymuconolactone decarboxylase family protein YurZ